MPPEVPTPAQREAIAKTTAHFQSQPSVQALLLGGSLVHGFATAASDVDVMIVVSDAELAQRSAQGQTTFFDQSMATWEGGYIDGKYVSPSFLAEVAARGSEPSRFAFQDAQLLFSRDDALPRLLAELQRYPVAGKEERIARFSAQLEAWTWMAGEAFKKGDPYLAATAVSRLTLFAGRMVLAHNELLYPFHKWFLRVLERAPQRPPAMVERIRALCRAPAPAEVTTFVQEVRAYRAWEVGDVKWPARFMSDTELDWMNGVPDVGAI
jgi:hypothetical protein